MNIPVAITIIRLINFLYLAIASVTYIYIWTKSVLYYTVTIAETNICRLDRIKLQ